MSDFDLDELRSELEPFAQPEKKGGRSALEERVIAGFEDIQRFVETHGRPPQHGEERDIFERLYAVRLDRLRGLTEYHGLLAPLDRQGLLQAAYAVPGMAEPIDDDELLSELTGDGSAADITNLRHVRPSAEIRAAEEVADRTPCKDFNRFKPLFAQAEADLKSGARETRRFGRDASIATGEVFILGGQMAYVAETGEAIRAPNGESDARLRVIYANGTESNLLRRSLQRALYKDEAGRRLTEPSAGPLFGGLAEEDDIESGTIYVLRSKSSHPTIAAHRGLIHKIGVTGGSVEARIAGAATQATYLLAEVEVVATYKLFNINRTRLENLIHRVFGAARFELTIPDRFGNPVQPREWFLVPLAAIDEAVDRIKDGSITSFAYDPTRGALVKVA